MTVRVSSCDPGGTGAAEFSFNEATVRGQEKAPLDLVGPPGATPTASVCPGAISPWSSCGLRVDCEWTGIGFVKNSQLLLEAVDKPVEA